MKFLVFFIFFEAQSYAETSIKDENIKKFKAAEKALETFNKKYWKPRTNQIFYIKDNTPSDNRVDLVNENFNISYSGKFSRRYKRLQLITIIKIQETFRFVASLFCRRHLIRLRQLIDHLVWLG